MQTIDATYWYIGFLLVMVSMHAFIPRYWIAGLIAAIVCVIISSSSYDLYMKWSGVRPSGVPMWLLTQIVIELAIFVPLSLLAGLPFMIVRRLRKS